MILDIQRLLSEIYQERLHAKQLYARQKARLKFRWKLVEFSTAFQKQNST